MLNKFLSTIVFLAFSTSVLSQENIGISNSGTMPHTSAILDISSSAKGLLIPRMSEAQRQAIATPANGLLVYQTTEPSGFYYNAGTPALPFWFTVSGPRLPYSGTTSAAEAFKINGIDQSNAIIGTSDKGIAIKGSSSGTGSPAVFESTNGANVNAVITAMQKGVGAGIKVEMQNVVGGNAGIDVSVAGENFGINTYSEGGTGILGRTGSISNAGLLGTNVYGEAVVGLTGGDPQFLSRIGAVVGRNDGAGYGVRGFVSGHPANAPAMYESIGVLGQAGHNGNKGIAARFINSNTANPSNVLEISSPARTVLGNGIYVNFPSTKGTEAAISAVNPSNNGNAIIGRADLGSISAGIWGISAGGYAGFFTGKVHVQGNLHVSGTLSKSAGSFKIDHPLDPENKFLVHSFVESPDMMNVYNGNITTDINGKATVELPAYFEAANKDFRYQLTVLDETQFALARVASKISNNRFIIITDKPGIEVSWQVTGIRNDAYAQQNRLIPELNKSKEETGRYLNPEVFGQPATKSIGLQKTPGAVEESNTTVEKNNFILPSAGKGF